MKATWQRLTKDLPDADDVFAYDTVKEVRVLDRRLGYVYYSVLLSVIIYIVLYVFLIKKQYLDKEKTNGWVLGRVINPAHDETNIPWDIMDSVTNPGEQGAVFVPTRILVTRGQVQDGFCESTLHPCNSDADCDIGHEEMQMTKCSNGFCMRRQWCPPENAEVPEHTEVHYVNLKSFDVWFQTNLHYHKFQLDVSTTDETESVRYPQMHANTYPVHDLLRMANINYEDVKEDGAIINVNNIFTCDLDYHKCEVQLEAQSIDSLTGFNYVSNHFYKEGGVRKRDSYRLYGIRIVTFATGIGQKTSFANIVLQVSSGIALLTCAQTVADVVMQYVLPERRHYVAKKVLLETVQ